MNFKLITPAAQVIDLPRAKLQCKITGADRDADLTDAIAAARDFVEAFLGVPVGEQVRRYTFECWPGCATFPFDVTSVEACTADGVAVYPLPALIADRTLKFDATSPVTIDVKCGYVVATLPATAKQAMLLLIADYVRNPQAQTDVELFKNSAIGSLLWPHRVRLPI